MKTHINEAVSVISVFNQEKGLVMPKKMRWNGRDYAMTTFAYHHRVHKGERLFHIFHVSDGANDYRLQLDAQTLHWMLVEVH